MRKSLFSSSSSFVTALLGIALGFTHVTGAEALPVERFESRLQISCGEGQRSCSGSIRDADTLGRITGFSIVKSSAGSVELDIADNSKGGLRVKAKEATDISLTLSWDSDLNPDILSGSGLNCFDLTRQGAYAFIISKASLRSSCHEPSVGGGCPTFSMETRVYNASDPTGQKFSASVVTRSLLDDTDIAVPFSNFIRQGPRGKGSFSCVGAVTMTLKFRGFSELELTTGPIYTNGEEGLTPLPTATEQPIETPTATPTLSPTSAPTIAPTDTVEPMATDSPVPSAAELPQMTAVLASPIATPKVAALPTQVVAPSISVTVRPSEAEEAVYGELVAE